MPTEEQPPKPVTTTPPVARKKPTPKPKLDIEKLAEEVAKKLSHPVSTHVEATIATTPAEHPSEVKVLEEKAVGIWSKIKAWKWFWLAVVGLAALIVFLVYNYFHNKSIQKGIEKTEVKKEELKKEILTTDTTLLQLRSKEIEKIKQLDSLKDLLNQAIETTKRREDFEKKNYR